jgi:ribosomal protein S18 acetylase RimI-like enzyme
MEHADFDPTLWWHLYEGDEMIANLWCNNNHEGDKTVGYVQSLGVRKPWRGKGLGRNLLLHSFGEFYRRGQRGAALDVDAHSLTGATRLYESVGMAETHRNAVYLKELRAGEDLATRSLD